MMNSIVNESSSAMAGIRKTLSVNTTANAEIVSLQRCRRGNASAVKVRRIGCRVRNASTLSARWPKQTGATRAAAPIAVSAILTCESDRPFAWRMTGIKGSIEPYAPKVIA
jgi:hypothetical protein